MQKAMNNFHVADLHASGKDLLSDRYHYMLDAWAFSYWKSGDLATAKKTLGRLYDVIELSDHKAAFLAATNTEMFIEISQDNWNRAVALGDRALALIDSDSIEFVNEQMRYFEMGRILAGVARLHYEFNPEKAITLHKRSLEISYASNNVLGIETDLHHLAILHLKTVDLEQARKYIDELIAASKLSGQKTGLLSAYTNLSHLHLLKTENKEAQRALLRAELYLEPNVVPALKEYYVLQAARLYQASADFEKALEIMEENKKLFANSNAPSVRRLPYLDLLASIYYELGMTEQALAIQARYHDLVKKLQQPKLSKATVSRNN
jgi:tetratricopeptide (TPR) repeat protein